MLDKYLPLFKFNKVFFIGIDQVRADIKIDGPFVAKEQSVGTFKDMKAASNIFSLQHNVQQWIFLSKTTTINRDSHYGIDGWHLNIMTEKNKVAPSKNYITCVFNKYSGIDKFWSEFVFLSELTYTEKKIFKTPEKLVFPLCIHKSSDKKSSLRSYDVEGKKIYESPPLFKKEFKDRYLKDEEFRRWFDYSVDISCQQRITNGMFKMSDYYIETEQVQEANELEIQVDQILSTDNVDTTNGFEPELDLDNNQINEELPVLDISDDEPVNDEFGYQSVF